MQLLSAWYTCYITSVIIAFMLYVTGQKWPCAVIDTMLYQLLHNAIFNSHWTILHTKYLYNIYKHFKTIITHMVLFYITIYIFLIHSYRICYLNILVQYSVLYSTTFCIKLIWLVTILCFHTFSIYPRALLLVLWFLLSLHTRKNGKKHQ